MKHGKVIAILFTGIFLLSVISQAIAQDDVIKERKSLMKSNRKAGKALKKAVKEKDFATIESSANVLVVNMGNVVALFPKGSTSKKSRAKAEIWEKWDDFSKHAATAKSAAQNLANVAMAKDGGGLDAAYKAVSASCGSCHKPFRKKRKRKKK